MTTRREILQTVPALGTVFFSVLTFPRHPVLKVCTCRPDQIRRDEE